MTPLIDGDVPFKYIDGGLYWITPARGRTVGRRVGAINSVGYRHFTYKYVIYLEHRVIYSMFHGDIPKHLVVDHKDRDKLNNKIENLRLVPTRDNIRNQDCKGYSWDKQKNKWKVRAHQNGTTIHIAHTETEQEAKEIFQAWRKEVWGCGH